LFVAKAGNFELLLIVFSPLVISHHHHSFAVIYCTAKTIPAAGEQLQRQRQPTPVLTAKQATSHPCSSLSAGSDAPTIAKFHLGRPSNHHLFPFPTTQAEHPLPALRRLNTAIKALRRTAIALHQSNSIPISEAYSCA
jgi:hypothetical protein